jgi:hypothetical protein
MLIPPWNSFAVLPPIRPGQSGHSADRSPYRVSLVEVVERFAHGHERIRILRGLIGYRKDLSQAGIHSGFQWLDGSFMEHKEQIHGTPPNDIDVVTFYRLASGQNQKTLIADHPQLFDRETIQKSCPVDAFYQQLGDALIPNDVRQIAYYYSMWSHRRNGIWKGFVEVKLCSEEDDRAVALLDHLEREGGRP